MADLVFYDTDGRHLVSRLCCVAYRWSEGLLINGMVGNRLVDRNYGLARSPLPRRNSRPDPWPEQHRLHLQCPLSAWGDLRIA